jgi:hypothetical protein
MREERESHELKLANAFPESLMGPQSRCKMCINSTLFRPPESFSAEIHLVPVRQVAPTIRLPWGCIVHTRARDVQDGQYGTGMVCTGQEWFVLDRNGKYGTGMLSTGQELSVRDRNGQYGTGMVSTLQEWFFGTGMVFRDRNGLYGTGMACTRDWVG